MSSGHSKEQHLRMNQAAWDAAQRAWFDATTAPNWHRDLRNGAVELDDTQTELLGDVSGLDVLQLSCAGDAIQAFSLANLGARVTACDYSPVAIENAKESAKAKLPYDFFVVARKAE